MYKGLFVMCFCFWHFIGIK